MSRCATEASVMLVRLVLPSVLLLAIAGCGGSGDGREAATATATATTTPAAAAGCEPLGLEDVMANGEALDCTLDADGTARRYVVYVPERASDGDAPLLVALHGDRIDLGVGRAAEGFILALPEGLDAQWNDAADTERPDDVAFIGAVIDAVVEAHSVDAERVYATGWSGGGFMVHRLACESADRLTAIAVLHAPLRGDCAPSRPVSVLQIVGTADDIVPANGGTTPDGTETPPVAAAMERWREASWKRSSSTRRPSSARRRLAATAARRWPSIGSEAPATRGGARARRAMPIAWMPANGSGLSCPGAMWDDPPAWKRRLPHAAAHGAPDGTLRGPAAGRTLEHLFQLAPFAVTARIHR